MPFTMLEIPFVEFEGTSALKVENEQKMRANNNFICKSPKKVVPLQAEMRQAVKIEKKQTGATFTPCQLADFLSAKILKYAALNDLDTIKVLDPACGDGALLNSFSQSIAKTKVNFYGFDTNLNYLKEATTLCASIPYNWLFKQQDFLDYSLDKANSEHYDVIIANPPYVRTQILGSEKAQQIASNFELSGRIDLYHAFLIGMTKVLKKGGILGVITSNRYLSTKSGAAIRKYLLENYEILEIIDLGDTKLFDAAVLPAIFIGRKKTNREQISCPCPFSKTYEYFGEKNNVIPIHANSIYEVIQSETPHLYEVGGTLYDHSIGLMKHESSPDGIWQMTCDEENKWIDTIIENTDFYISDKFKVRVGIKSCADNVFINPQVESISDEIESDLLKTLISQENISAWHTDNTHCQNVIYPHYSIHGKRYAFDIDNYPHAKKYLEKHRQQLEARTYILEAKRQWYEMWVPQNPSLFNKPKLIFPDISLEPRFAYDTTGAIVNGNCYWIVAENAEEESLLLLIEGVANSKVMMKYHDLRFNNKLYSGRRRYLAQYVEKYPMPNPNNQHSKNIIEIVKQLNCSIDADKQQLLNKLNDEVEHAFGLK